MRGPDFSQEQSSARRAVADHVSGTGKSRPAASFQLNNPSPAALLQKKPADNAPVQMYNETLIAIAEYLGVAPVIETVAAAIGISAGALIIGLGTLSAVALWSVPKIIQYLTGKPAIAPQGKSTKKRRKRRKKGKHKQPTINTNITPTAEEESEQSDNEEETEEIEEREDVTDITEADHKEEAPVLEEKEKADDGSDSDDWTPARKYKVRKTKTEKAEEAEDRARHALEVAKAHLLKMSKKRSGSTVSVFLNANGGIISTGESGWSRKDYSPDHINRHLTNMLVAEKGQQQGYGGLVCAEPQAILNAGGSLSSAKYSLAYDTKSKKFKCACGSCTKYLQDKNILDLATLL